MVHHAFEIPESPGVTNPRQDSHRVANHLPAFVKHALGHDVNIILSAPRKIVLESFPVQVVLKLPHQIGDTAQRFPA